MIALVLVIGLLIVVAGGACAVQYRRSADDRAVRRATMERSELGRIVGGH